MAARSRSGNTISAVGGLPGRKPPVATAPIMAEPTVTIPYAAPDINDAPVADTAIAEPMMAEAGLPIAIDLPIPEPALTDTAPAPVETAADITPPAAAAAPALAKEETMESITDTVADTMTEATDGANAAAFKGQEMSKDMVEFSKGNVEAMVESSKIAARGLQTIGQDYVDYSKKSLESATAMMKTAVTIKTPMDLFKLQGDYARDSFDMLVAQASKNTEAMMKLAGDAAQPLSSRVALAAEKVKLAA